MVDEIQQDAALGEAADELVRLLNIGMFDQFLELYRRSATGVQDGAVVLAELINERVIRERPGSEVAIVVSQQVSDKHLVVIQDGSRFFGNSWTISRNMFVV